MNKKVIVVLIFLIIALVASVPIGHLIMNNRALKETVGSQQNEISTLQNQAKNLQSENKTLTKKNQDLTQENRDLIKAFNEENQTINKAAQTGTAKPNRVGFGPQFTLVSRGGFDRYQRQDILENLSKGSYQYQKEKVCFDVDDRKSWSDLGDWFVSCYTATVDECDNNPSITASGKLVTPSFTVAVDPKFWKYGTIFYFQDLGFGIAADCGGSVKGKNRADFLVASKTFARSSSGNQRVYLVYTPE